MGPYTKELKNMGPNKLKNKSPGYISANGVFLVKK